MLGKGVSCGGEVKSIEAKEKTRSSLLCLDLYRLVHFSKDLVDDKHFSQVLCYQAIGLNIVLFVYTLLGDSFYAMVELFKVKIPSNIREISNLTIKDFNNLCSIQHLLSSSRP
jgi:hypothetical protein